MSEMDGKWKSRTWLLVVFWFGFSVLITIAQVILRDLVELPVGTVITFAGTASVAYMGKRSVQEARKNNGK